MSTGPELVRHGVTPQYWDEVATLEDHLPVGWRRHARRAHLALIERWVGRPAGRWLKTDLHEELSPHRALLPHLEGAWVAVDLSEQAATAPHRAACSSALADLRGLPFADAAFDGVLSTSTLDHFDDVADIDRSLVELRRVTRPGGLLVLTLDNPSNPLILLRSHAPDALKRATRLVPFHVGPTLSDREGVAALRRAGFEVSAVAYLLHVPHIVGTRLARFGWVERRLPFVDRLGHTRLRRRTAHFVAFLAEATNPHRGSRAARTAG